MAGQFDKYVKILGSGSRPDRFQGVPGQYEGDPNAVPDMVVPPLLTVEDTINVGGKDKNITKAAVNVAKRRKTGITSQAAAAAERGSALESAQNEKDNLPTTTMRESADGSVQDYEDVQSTTMRPTPRGNVTDLSERPGLYGNPGRKGSSVRPTRQANPKYLAADVQRENEDRKALMAANTKLSVPEKDKTGEFSFNKSEEAKGSSLRSINGVTFDENDVKWDPNKDSGKAPLPWDIDKETWAGSQVEAQVKAKSDKIATAEAAAKAESDKLAAESEAWAKARGEVYEKPSGKVSDYKPTPSKGNIAAEKADALLTQGAKIAAKKESENKSPTTVGYGETLAKENTSVTTPYDEKGNVKPEYNDPNTIYSTTMQEHNGEIVEGGIQKAPYQKPENWKKPTRFPSPAVPKPRVLPISILDTSATERVDVRQAEIDRRLHVANKTEPTRTTPYDPNERPARAQAGQTPEAGLIAAAKRETRATDLAAEGKTMTTVAPEVMATAKSIGKTSRYGLDEDYMNQTAFLSHEAVQKAVVAHALGVHDLLGTDNDKLHQYLGGRPLEAKSRLASAYKIVDRNRRGLPEKLAGEFDLLRGMVHAGTSASQTRRGLVQGKTSKVVVNGQSVTLAEGSPENRALTHAKASKITDETEAAPKAVVPAPPYAPEAGRDRYGLRKVGEPIEAGVLTDFSPAELRNKKMVPGSDDSKAPMGPVEKEVTSESPDLMERMKKGPTGNPPKEKTPVAKTFAKVTGPDFAAQSAERTNLKTTTMRLNEKGEAYDTEDKK
jgi:hypothetical protein